MTEPAEETPARADAPDTAQEGEEHDEGRLVIGGTGEKLKPPPLFSSLPYATLGIMSMGMGIMGVVVITIEVITKQALTRGLPIPFMSVFLGIGALLLAGIAARGKWTNGLGGLIAGLIYWSIFAYHVA